VSYAPRLCEQPDYQTKLDTLRGVNTGWHDTFYPPPVCTGQWDNHAWIAHIGHRWFRKDQTANGGTLVAVG
jgi:hypothetical protein